MIVKACWAGSKTVEENPAWALQRAPLRERDKSLAPEAHAWLASLPLMVHPRELCARYPRIANRFALLWPDAHLTEHYFEALLIDKRGNRRGFTTRITEELQHLRSFHREQHGLKTKDTATQNRLFELLRTVVGAPLPKGDQPA